MLFPNESKCPNWAITHQNARNQGFLDNRFELEKAANNLAKQTSKKFLIAILFKYSILGAFLYTKLSHAFFFNKNKNYLA